MISPLDLVKNLDAFQNAWTNLRADVMSHLVLAIGLYLLGDIALWSFISTDFDALLSSQWIQSLRGAGLLSLVPVTLVAALFAYGVVLRAIGNGLMTLQFLIFPLRLQNWPVMPLVSDSDIETIALTLGGVDFTPYKVTSRLHELQLKYRMEHESQRGSDVTSLRQSRQNTQGYLCNSMVFLLGWVALYIVMPRSATRWAIHDLEHFLPMLIFLLGFALWARLHFVGMVRRLSQMEIVSVAQMVRRDPDLGPLVNHVRRANPSVRRRVVEMRKQARLEENWRPSLVAYLRWRVKGKKKDGSQANPYTWTGWPFVETYATGRRFAFDGKRRRSYDDQWLRHYRAYLYYLFCRRIEVSGKAIWQVGVYVVTGELGPSSRA